MKIQFLVILSLVSSAFSSQECQQLLTRISTATLFGQQKQVFQEAVPYIWLSGKGINQYGDYDACISQNYQYANAVLQDAQTGMGVQFGICLTKQCTIEEINADIETFKIAINYFTKPAMDLDVSKVNILLYDPKNIYPEKTSLTYMIILLIIIIIVLSLKNDVQQLFEQFFSNWSQQEPTASNIELQNLEQFTEIPISAKEEGIHVESGKERVIVSENRDFSILANSFQLSVNTKKFWEETNTKLGIFYGFRGIGFLMVIYGHTFLNLLLNDISALSVFSQVFVMGVINTCFAVDLFFWISGFFLPFVMLNPSNIVKLRKTGISIIPGAILKRLIRICPCYYFCILINWRIQPYLGEGPRWQMGIQGLGSCENTWWQNFLFISNLFPENKCFGWGWYLSVDMQLFVIGVLIMYIYITRSVYLAKVLMFLIMSLTLYYGAKVSYENQFLIPYYQYQKFEMIDLMDFDYYFNTWCRAPPYILGLILGVMYREIQLYEAGQTNFKPILVQLSNYFGKSKFKQWFLYVMCYLLGTSIIMTIFFGWYNAFKNGQSYWPIWLQTTYWSFSKLVFAIGLSLITLPQLIGINDIFNTKFMDNKFFRFLTKISFSGYLIHFIIILIIVYNFYDTIQLDSQHLTTYFVGMSLITFIIASLLTILVEMPFANYLNSQLNWDNQKRNLVR